LQITHFILIHNIKSSSCKEQVKIRIKTYRLYLGNRGSIEMGISFSGKYTKSFVPTANREKYK